MPRGFRRLLHRLPQPGESALRHLRLAIDVGEPGNRPREQCRVQQKAHQLRRRESAVGKIRARQGQHQHDARGCDQLRQRLQRSVDSALLYAQAKDAIDLLAIPRRFLLFAGEGLDRRQHAQVFLSDGDRNGVLLLQLPRQRPHAATDDFHQQIEQGNEDHRQQRQDRADAKHQNHRAARGEQQRHQRKRGAADKAAQDINVVGKQRQGIAETPLVIVGQGQGLKMVVQPDLQIGDDLVGDIAEDSGIAELEQRLQSEQTQHAREDDTDSGGRHTGRRQHGLGEQASGPGDEQRGCAFDEHQQPGKRQRHAMRRGKNEQRSQITHDPNAVCLSQVMG